MPEQLLSACVAEIDDGAIDPPLDVHPDTGYDPLNDNAPLRIFATGIRNAVELVAHPNGRMYAGVNQNERPMRLTSTAKSHVVADDLQNNSSNASPPADGE